MKRQQDGAALITVLIVFAIVSILASTLVLRSQAAIERTTMFLGNTQSMHYALGGETLARQIIYRGLNNDFKNTHWKPDTYPVFQPENGEVSLEIIDLQGRINLNNLTLNPALAAVTRQQIERLASRFIQPSQGVNAFFVDKLIDWMDSDNIALSNGGEDFIYLNQQPPYRTANRPLTSLSELQLIQGMQPDSYLALSPMIVTLPTATKININTATARVIEALFTGINGEQITSTRDATPEGFSSLEDFLRHGATAGLDVDTASLTLDSRYWEVRIVARFNEQTTYLVTRLNMGHGDKWGTVLDRDFGQWFSYGRRTQPGE